MNDPTPTRWPGVSRPNYSPIPDDYLDFAMATLKGAEFKVLMYVARRTFGFKRQSDRISLTQICSGITRKDGTVIERGTGLSRQGAVSAIRSLIDQGYIHEEKSSSDERGNEVNTYTIVFNSPNPVPDEAPPTPAPEAMPPQSNYLTRDANNLAPWSNNLTSPGQQAGPPPSQQNGSPLVKLLDPQKTVDRETGNRKTGLSNRRARGDGTTGIAPSDSSDSMQQNGGQDGHRDDAARTNSADVVAEYVTALGEEFGDDAPHASRTRVANLRRETELDDDTLLELLEEAAAITRSQGHAIGKRGRGGRPIHMPYLLRTLEGLLDPARSARVSPPRPDGLVPGVRAPSVGARPLPVGETDDVWSAALAELQLILTPENYNTWLATTRVVARTGDLLRIGVPKPFQREWLERKLHGRVISTLRHLGHGGMRVEYVVLVGGDGE